MWQCRFEGLYIYTMLLTTIPRSTMARLRSRTFSSPSPQLQAGPAVLVSRHHTKGPCAIPYFVKPVLGQIFLESVVEGLEKVSFVFRSSREQN